MRTLAETFASQGFVVLPDVISEATCLTIAELVGRLPLSGAGSRRLLEASWCRDLAHQVRQHPGLAKLLPLIPVAVQCTLFDKSPDRNWLVGLHQDRSIPVSSRVDSAELSGWSEKEGNLFVQPPGDVLEQVTAVRIHLDPCPVEGGALRVVPNSHRRGLLSSDEANRFREQCGEMAVPSPRGSALVLKPLLLHASSKAAPGLQRRVLHFVFGPRDLPLGLRWRNAV